MSYKICEYCGAHLDPGEICDCRKEEQDDDKEKIKEDDYHEDYSNI